MEIQTFIGRNRISLPYTVCLSLIVIFQFLINPQNSLAANPTHGAKGAAMVSAFVALADDPSAIAFNPAGLVQLEGTNIYGGLSALSLPAKYTSPSGASQTTEDQIFVAPHFFYTSHFGGTETAYGVGIYSMYGIGGGKWGKTGLTRYVSAEGFTSTVSINPTIARRVSSNLTVGAGLNYVLSQMKSEVMLDQSMVGGTDGGFLLEGDGSGWGYNVGVLYTPFEKLTFGLAYRNGVDVKLKGDANVSNIAPALQAAFGGSSYKTGFSTTTKFPEFINVGIAYKPNEQTVLLFEVERVGWSTSKTIDLDLENEVPAAGFTDSSTVIDWVDIWVVKLGADYTLSDKWSVRGGYGFFTSGVPNHTLGPGNPDSFQHTFGAGFGYRTNRLLIDAYYSLAFYEKRTVQNNVLSGTYQKSPQYAGISIGYSM